MGFIDFIQKKEGRNYNQRGGGLNLRQPLVNILLGQFEERELQALLDGFSSQMTPQGQVFWLSTRRTGSDAVICLPVPAVERYSFEARKELQTYAGTSEELKHGLEKAVREIFNSAMEHIYAEQGRIRLNFLVKTDELE